MINQRNEALNSYDIFFASVMNGFCSQSVDWLLTRTQEAQSTAIDDLINLADEVAHKMVLQKYSKLNKSVSENDNIDYLSFQ